MQLHIYQDSKGQGQCRSCGAVIYWAELFGSGKRHPFNRPISAATTIDSLLPGGRTIEIIDTDQVPSHFATCPHAAAHRRR